MRVSTLVVQLSVIWTEPCETVAIRALVRQSALWETWDERIERRIEVRCRKVRTVRVVITPAIARHENCARLEDHEPVTGLQMHSGQVIDRTKLTTHASLHLVKRTRPSDVDRAEIDDEICLGIAAVTCAGPTKTVRTTGRALHDQLTATPRERPDATRKIRDGTRVSEAAVGCEALRRRVATRVKHSEKIAALEVQPCDILDRTRLP
jgi:hypothetical protein